MAVVAGPTGGTAAAPDSSCCSICLLKLNGGGAGGGEAGDAAATSSSCPRCANVVHARCQEKWNAVLAQRGRVPRCTVCRCPLKRRPHDLFRRGGARAEAEDDEEEEEQCRSSFFEALLADRDMEAVELELRAMRQTLRSRFHAVMRRVCERKAALQMNVRVVKVEEGGEGDGGGDGSSSSSSSSTTTTTEGFVRLVTQEHSRSLSYFERAFHSSTAQGTQRLNSPFFAAWRRFSQGGGKLQPLLRLRRQLAVQIAAEQRGGAAAEARVPGRLRVIAAVAPPTARGGSDGGGGRGGRGGGGGGVGGEEAEQQEGQKEEQQPTLVDVTGPAFVELTLLQDLHMAVHSYAEYIAALENSPAYRQQQEGEAAWDRERQRSDLAAEEEHRQRFGFAVASLGALAGGDFGGGGSMGGDCRM